MLLLAVDLFTRSRHSRQLGTFHLADFPPHAVPDATPQEMCVSSKGTCKPLHYGVTICAHLNTLLK